MDVPVYQNCQEHLIFTSLNPHIFHILPLLPSTENKCVNNFPCPSLTCHCRQFMFQHINSDRLPKRSSQSSRLKYVIENTELRLREMSTGPLAQPSCRSLFQSLLFYHDSCISSFSINISLLSTCMKNLSTELMLNCCFL